MSQFYERGALLLQQKRTELAIEQFMLHLGHEPNCPDGHCMLALCFLGLDKMNEALDFSEKAVSLAPDEAFPYFVLSRVYLDSNKYKKAIACADDGIEVDPMFPDLWGVKAFAYIGVHEFKKGLEAAEIGLEIEPAELHL